MRSSGPKGGEWIYPRLLVVDDNPLNLRLAERVLTKMNYCVDVVGDGLQALEAAHHSNYLAILMDCEMPVMDGFEASSRIRAMSGLTGRTPIIAMTAPDTSDPRRRCVRAGMNAFTSKPVDWTSIEALLRKAVAGGLHDFDDADTDASFATEPRDIVALSRDVVAQIMTDQDAPQAITELVRLFRSETQDLFDRLGVALAGDRADETRALLAGQGRFDDAIQCADQMWDKLGLVLNELDRSAVVAGPVQSGSRRNAAWAPPTVDHARQAPPNKVVGRVKTPARRT